MSGNRGLKRLLIFVVFLVPVGWYFFLQFFGSNQFAVEVVSKIPSRCGYFSEVAVIYKTDSINSSKSNSLNRVTYRTEAKQVLLIADSLQFFSCIEKQADLALVSKDGLWGTYTLDREGVDRLLTELDILTIQEAYGKGTSR